MKTLKQLHSERAKLLHSWLLTIERPTRLGDKTAISRFLSTNSASANLLDKLLPYYLGKKLPKLKQLGRPKQ
jgi:hypothetical protein